MRGGRERGLAYSLAPLQALWAQVPPPPPHPTPAAGPPAPPGLRGHRGYCEAQTLALAFLNSPFIKFSPVTHCVVTAGCCL